VARKFQVHGGVKTAATAVVAAAGGRLVPFPLAGAKVLPRVKKIPAVRRRLPVLMMPPSTQQVKIRHVLQNLGSAVSEIQPAQTQRV
jgi:hypothetical protein